MAWVTIIWEIWRKKTR